MAILVLLLLIDLVVIAAHHSARKVSYGFAKVLPPRAGMWGSRESAMGWEGPRERIHHVAPVTCNPDAPRAFGSPDVYTPDISPRGAG